MTTDTTSRCTIREWGDIWMVVAPFGHRFENGRQMAEALTREEAVRLAETLELRRVAPPRPRCVDFDPGEID